MAEAKTNPTVEIRPFTISRTFNVSRAKLWDVVTNPEHMQHWFGPKGATGKTVKIDFRPGGFNHYYLDFNGTTIWGKSLYREIIPPVKLVYINTFSDEKGGLGRHPMSPQWPQELLTTFTFDEKGGKTTFNIRWEPINALDEEIKLFNESHASMNQGWGGSFEQLDEYLKKINGAK